MSSESPERRWEGIPDLAVIQPASVPKEITCAVCLNLCLDPVITPCQHMFCKACMEFSMQEKRICPLDRLRLSEGSITPLSRTNPLLYRIWSGVDLRCPNACHWTGSGEGYKEHMTHCIPPTKANAELKATVVGLRRSKRALSEELKDTRLELFSARAKIPKLTSYSYTRSQAVELAQYIAVHVNNCPAGVDRNRIFSNVTQITDSFLQVLAKNTLGCGERHELDFLLSSCLASNWFSTKQNKRLRRLLYLPQRSGRLISDEKKRAKIPERPSSKPRDRKRRAEGWGEGRGPSSGNSRRRRLLDNNLFEEDEDVCSDSSDHDRSMNLHRIIDSSSISSGGGTDDEGDMTVDEPSSSSSSSSGSSDDDDDEEEEDSTLPTSQW